jgi:hypothetical protein
MHLLEREIYLDALNSGFAGLEKLQVRSRGKAAAVANRLGLGGSSPTK